MAELSVPTTYVTISRTFDAIDLDMPAERLEHAPPAAKPFECITALLGGRNIFHREIRSTLDAHDLMARGFPGAVLTYLLENMVLLHDPEQIQKAVGVSLRTLQRRKETPAKRLSQEQSGRAWKFAEVLCKATSVMGTREAAEQWLISPATALEQRCPLDLLSSPAGTQLVEDLLERLEYGVYA